MADVWFTADTHFNHGMLVEKDHRPFTDVIEMNEVIVERWNRAVKPGDTVWHLGDWEWALRLCTWDTLAG